MPDTEPTLLFTLATCLGLASLQSDGLHGVELQGLDLKRAGFGNKFDGSWAFGSVAEGAHGLTAVVYVHFHAAAIHEHAQLEFAGSQSSAESGAVR